MNPNAIKTHLDRNRIEVIGRRETIGHPELFATTRQFLLDLGLNSLQDLPSIGPEEEPQLEAFELFEGQTQTENKVSRAGKLNELKGLDAEHARLESLIEPLDFGDDNNGH